MTLDWNLTPDMQRPHLTSKAEGSDEPPAWLALVVTADLRR